MSIDVMTRVWKHAPVKGNQLLVLLAMADICNDEGRSLYPSIALLASKCRMSECTARRMVYELVNHRPPMIEILREGGGRFNNEYRICVEHIVPPVTPGNSEKLPLPHQIDPYQIERGALSDCEGSPITRERAPLSQARDEPSYNRHITTPSTGGAKLTAVQPNFQPTQETLDRCRIAGCPSVTNDRVQMFVATLESRGKLSANWQSEFYAWMIRERVFDEQRRNTNATHRGNSKQSAYARAIAGAFEADAGDEAGEQDIRATDDELRPALDGQVVKR